MKSLLTKIVAPKGARVRAGQLIVLISSQLFFVTLYSQSPQLSGWVRGSVYGGAKEYQLSSLFSEARVEATLERESALMYGDIRFRAGTAFGQSYTKVQLKELYLGYSNKIGGLKVGNQIVNWSKTELFAPNPSITPFDPFFFSAEPDDQRLSNFALLGEFNLSQKVKGSIVWLPIYKESNYRFDLFNLGPGILFDAPILPHHNFENGSIAAKLEFTNPGVDFALSYFRGYNTDYGFKMLSFTPVGVEGFVISNSAAPYLRESVGAGGEAVVGGLVLRGEFALNFTEGYKEAMHIPYPSIELALGGEFNIAGATLIAEYSLKKGLEFTPLPTIKLPNPNDPVELLEYSTQMAKQQFELLNRKIFRESREYNHAGGVALSKNFYNDQFKVEMATLALFSTGEWLVRGGLEWSITDNLTASIGLNILGGKERTPLFYMKEIANGGYIQLKYSF